MNPEVWRQSLAPNYEVSSYGRVRRSSPGRKTWAGRVMKLQAMECGYLSVRPTVDGKNKHFYVHDLVAAAFIGAKPEAGRVNHIDTDKHNNLQTNLEYTTHAGNMAHAAENGCMPRGESHVGSKLTEQGVRQIRADRSSGLSYSKLAARHGIATATAFNIVNRKLWSHVA